MSEYFLLYLALGAAAGFLAGLFGIGGGLILVPFLAGIYAAQDFPNNRIMLMAIATSLSTIIPTALSSVSAHHRHGAVRWNIVLKLAPGILAGSLIGTVIAQELDTGSLKTIFGAFLISVSIQTGFRIQPEKQSWVLGRLLGLLAGALIGAFSSLVGIGGGTLTVPLLLKCQQPI
ncbi:MAG: sulfite exporter TauE/SafE family protein, partial [Methylococcales bacterium]